MREQLSIPESKSRAQGTLEVHPDCVNNPRFPYVHKTQVTRSVVQQDPQALGFTHQSHRDNLITGHEEPLALGVAKHPGGAVGADAVLPGHGGLGHTEAELLRLFHRHLPIMSSAADLLVPEHDGPVAEALRVVLHVARVQA